MCAGWLCKGPLLVGCLTAVLAVGCEDDGSGGAPATDTAGTPTDVSAQDIAADTAEDVVVDVAADVVPPPDVPPAEDVQPDIGQDVAKPTTQLCFTCHVGASAKLQGGKHAKLADACVSCHSNGLDHQVKPSEVVASIDMSIESCGKCHSGHEETYLKDDGAKPGKYGGSQKTSNYEVWQSYKYLMGGHGFTKEYNEDRAHKFMLKDHIEIQRKQNAGCMQCKSTAVAYYWNETRRGKPTYGKDMTWADIIAKLKVEQPKTLDYGAGCNHCHDPHGTGFRVVRKAMVTAILERGTDPYGKENFVPKTPAELEAKMNEKGPDGKPTTEARRLAGTLTCAQCHVEYTCGPGADSAKGIIRDDFPWRKLSEIEDYYKVKYGNLQDWTHSLTQIPGVKAQHPETEFYWGSTHYKVGAACTTCHMASQGAGAAKSHWLTSPLKHPEATCGSCHTDVPARIAKTQASQDAFMVKAKQAEAALNEALQLIEAGTKQTPPPANLDAAKTAFMKGLLWWEFTSVSENSAGWHNPQEADTNLDKALEMAAQVKGLLQPK